VYSRDRKVVPIDKISPYMQKAIVAIEDGRFYALSSVRPSHRPAPEGRTGLGTLCRTPSGLLGPGPAYGSNL
ncbi:hypothetical protein ABZ318_39295, partial [Streptomyces sp. NPDC006197]|uniref:transglycosylase domain-containing protein n=1 Tax=Streptomyces sp. NPDC006197 TaxID=3156685 RepID=UPI0033B24DC3